MKLNLSLHQANKFRSQLITKFKRTSVKGSVSETINNRSTRKEVAKNLQYKVEQQEKSNQMFLNILNVEATLKKLIFNKNSESGVSDVLEDIKLVKNKITVYEKLKNGQKNNDTNIENLDIKEKVKSVNDSEDIYYSINVTLATKTVLEDITQLKRELRDLENKCNELNVSNKIEIEITDDIKEEFGF